jgi:hypothetical protein
VTRLDRRALGMLAGTVVLVAATLPLAAGREQAFDTVLYATLPLVLAVVGTLIASRHPGNLIGWMLCGLALWGATAELGEAYGYVAAERGLPGGIAGEGLVSWSWIVDVTAWVVVALLFPDGQLPGRRWRPAIWVSLAGAGCCSSGRRSTPGRPSTTIRAVAIRSESTARWSMRPSGSGPRCWSPGSSPRSPPRCCATGAPAASNASS